MGDSWATSLNARKEWDRFLTHMRQQHGDFTVRRCFAGCSGDAFFRRWNSVTNDFLPGHRECDSASLGNVVHETSTCPSEMTNECAAALGPADIVIHVEHWEWVNAGVVALAEDCILDLDPYTVKPAALWHFFTVPAADGSLPSEPLSKSPALAVRSVEEQNELIHLHLAALAEAVSYVHLIYLINVFAMILFHLVHATRRASVSTTCWEDTTMSWANPDPTFGRESYISLLFGRVFLRNTRGILYPGPLDKPY